MSSSVDPYDLYAPPPRGPLYAPTERNVTYVPISGDYSGMIYATIAMLSVLILIIVILNLVKFKKVYSVPSPFLRGNRPSKPSLTRGAKAEVVDSVTL